MAMLVVSVRLCGQTAYVTNWGDGTVSVIVKTTFPSTPTPSHPKQQLLFHKNKKIQN